jgi:hypothetical protein
MKRKVLPTIKLNKISYYKLHIACMETNSYHGYLNCRKVAEHGLQEMFNVT